MSRLSTHAEWLLVPSLPKEEERDWKRAMLFFVVGAAPAVGAFIEYIEDSQGLNPNAFFQTFFFVLFLWSFAALHVPPVYGHRGVTLATQAAFMAALFAYVTTFFLDLSTDPGGSLSLSLETDPFLWALGLALLAFLSVANYVRNRRRERGSSRTAPSSSA